MTWSYDPEMGTDKDKVRLLVGDTDSAAAQFENEELQWLITENGNIYLAAAAACSSLATKWAKAVDKQVGDLRIYASQRASAYRQAADAYRVQGGGDVIAVAPWSGGQTRSDKDFDRADVDRIQPYFRGGEMSFPPGRDSDNSTDAPAWTR